MSEDIKPTVDIPFDEALQELTGIEILMIQKHYGMELEKLGGIRSIIGAVWAFENRDHKASWADVEKMALKHLHGYFAEPAPDPESEQGKDSTSSEETPDD